VARFWIRRTAQAVHLLTLTLCSFMLCTLDSHGILRILISRKRITYNTTIQHFICQSSTVDSIVLYLHLRVSYDASLSNPEIKSLIKFVRNFPRIFQISDNSEITETTPKTSRNLVKCHTGRIDSLKFRYWIFPRDRCNELQQGEHVTQSRCCFGEITTNKFQHGYFCTRAPRGPGFPLGRSAHEGARRERREQAERIVESNIRRTFTVRFPNLYCVWQRCRDIRGSYRNVLLLIVLHPEANGGRERRVAACRTETEDRKGERGKHFGRTRDGRSLYGGIYP